MAKPVATATGVCFAFPDLLLTPSPNGAVSMPYPNVAQLSQADPVATDVTAGGKAVVHEDSTISTSTGGEPGSLGAADPAASGSYLGACTFEASSLSATVKVNGRRVVRQGDTTSQNGGNATGTVMTGLPTVLVGD
jgi:uncharacterized Zn-binding protein involved in type VI secretion